MILADAHVHIYECFDLEKFFDVAYANFESEAANLGQRNTFTAVLLLAEAANENWFSRLYDHSNGKTGADGTAIGNWTFHRTHENCSLYVRSENTKSLLLIAGRQIVTAENLEVLALATTANFEDGFPIIELVEAVKKSGGLPVIPWGFGKWLGRRGTILRKLIESSENIYPFIGDNGGRPEFLPIPSHFKLAKKRKLRILPGSDPLPIAAEYKRVGRFGFYFDGLLSSEHPAKDLKKNLLDSKIQFHSYGCLERPIRFFHKQLFIRLKQVN